MVVVLLSWTLGTWPLGKSSWAGPARGQRPVRTAWASVLAYLAFPPEHWRQAWSNNPLERLNREVKRRTDVVGIFPDAAAVLRLVGAILAEQHDEWQVARRYLSAESLAKLTAPAAPPPPPHELPLALVATA
jgi:transposase-like protein